MSFELIFSHQGRTKDYDQLIQKLADPDIKVVNEIDVTFNLCQSSILNNNILSTILLTHCKQ